MAPSAADLDAVSLIPSAVGPTQLVHLVPLLLLVLEVAVKSLRPQAGLFHAVHVFLSM